MKTIITLFLTLLIAQTLIAQQKIITVSGQLTDNNGEPLPGVNIIIKGTATGTISDIDGNYSIEAPVGSVLVFNFIGYLAEEMQVTEDMANDYEIVNEVPENSVNHLTGNNLSGTPKIYNSMGVATAIFSDSSATYRIHDFQESRYRNNYYINNNNSGYRLNPNSVWKIKPGKPDYKNAKTVYTVKTNRILKFYLPKVYYFTSYSIDEPVWYQKTQTTYSQGLPMAGAPQWFGPESEVSFSWGPDIRLLEYDGSDYIFDSYGRLVAAGTGNGIPAKSYNPMNFFRNGSYLTNKLKIEDRFGRFGYAISYQNNSTRGIIPGSRNNSGNAGLKLDYDHNGRLKMNGNLIYHSSESKLALTGSNQLRLMKSVSLTPPTFDNSQSYLLNDGNIRSYNPETSFNPYWLINNIPDNAKNTRLITNLGAEMYLGYSTLSYEMAYDNQQNDNTYGISANDIAFENGIVTERNEGLIMIHNAVSYKHFLRNFRNRLKIDFIGAIQSDYYERNLKRKDFEGYSMNDQDVASTLLNKLDTLNIRSAYMVNTISQIRFRNYFNLKIANTMSWSSTMKSKKTGFSPNLGLNINLSEMPFWKSGTFSFLRIFANYTHVLSEAPINYTFGKYSSLLLDPLNSNRFYEQTEILFSNELNPEHQNKFNAGLGTAIFRNIVHADINFFSSSTKDHVVPITNGDHIYLVNGADLRDRGYEITTSVTGRIRVLGIEKAKLNISIGHSNPFVTNVYDPFTNIRIAGFQNFGSYLIKDQPYGMFVGSRFLRNEYGQMIIGADGFPQADPEPGMIGNPNPDWDMGIEGKLEWHNFSLQCLVDIRRGGDIWNGTSNTMNYYGVSDITGELRNTRGYVFEGVMADGSPNSIPVDLANPASGLEQNRWVRYGIDGVDEDAISDGSYVRLKEAKFEYSFNLYNIFRFPVNARIAVFGRNLFISNKHSLLPWNTFLGQPEGNGFDYFNMPGTRSFGFAFEMGF